MKEKANTIITWCIALGVTVTVFGGYAYLINANDRRIAAKQEACASIVSKVEDSENWHIIAESIICKDSCMYERVDELVNGYGLKEPSEIYQAAKRKCEYTLPK